MYCQACGAYNPAGTSACLQCGALLAATVDPAGPKCRLHPETPAAGTCGRCGSFGCGVCLTQRGDQWLCSDCLGRVGTLPWDERESIGTWRAWWRTCVQLISSPTSTLESARSDGSFGGSVLFSLLSTLVGYGMTVGVLSLSVIPAMVLGAKRGEAGDLTGVAIVLLGFVFYAVLILVVQMAILLVFAALDHVMLLMLGAQPKRYEVSVRANALAMAPALVGLVPLCGVYVWPLWAIVLRIIALMHLHKTTAGKAAAAVLIPTVLFCGLCGSLYFAAFAAGLSGFK
ncbi:MAG: YIP1 family protein [Myxococcota bacterium]